MARHSSAVPALVSAKPSTQTAWQAQQSGGSALVQAALRLLESLAERPGAVARKVWVDDGLASRWYPARGPTACTGAVHRCAPRLGPPGRPPPVLYWSSRSKQAASALRVHHRRVCPVALTAMSTRGPAKAGMVWPWMAVLARAASRTFLGVVCVWGGCGVGGGGRDHIGWVAGWNRMGSRFERRRSISGLCRQAAEARGGVGCGGGGGAGSGGAHARAQAGRAGVRAGRRGVQAGAGVRALHAPHLNCTKQYSSPPSVPALSATSRVSPYLQYQHIEVW